MKILMYFKNKQWDRDTIRPRYNVECLLLVSKIVLLEIIILGLQNFGVGEQKICGFLCQLMCFAYLLDHIPFGIHHMC